MLNCDTCHWHFHRYDNVNGICANTHYGVSVDVIKEKNFSCNDYKPSLQEFCRLVNEGIIDIYDDRF